MGSETEEEDFGRNSFMFMSRCVNVCWSGDWELNPLFVLCEITFQGPDLAFSAFAAILQNKLVSNSFSFKLFSPTIEFNSTVAPVVSVRLYIMT